MIWRGFAVRSDPRCDLMRRVTPPAWSAALVPKLDGPSAAHWMEWLRGMRALCARFLFGVSRVGRASAVRELAGCIKCN